MQVVPLTTKIHKLYPSEAYVTLQGKQLKALADQLTTVSNGSPSEQNRGGLRCRHDRDRSGDQGSTRSRCLKSGTSMPVLSSSRPRRDFVQRNRAANNQARRSCLDQTLLY